jgi:hypothetical protein
MLRRVIATMAMKSSDGSTTAIGGTAADPAIPLLVT